MAGITSDANVLTNELRLIAQRSVSCCATVLHALFVSVFLMRCGTENDVKMLLLHQVLAAVSGTHPLWAAGHHFVWHQAGLHPVWRYKQLNPLTRICNVFYIKMKSSDVWSSAASCVNQAFACVLVFKENGHLVSRCSTWAGINTTASSSTRATPVETTAAGRLHASGTTALWVSQEPRDIAKKKKRYSIPVIAIRGRTWTSIQRGSLHTKECKLTIKKAVAYFLLTPGKLIA